MKNAEGNNISTNTSLTTFLRFITGYSNEKWAFDTIYINNRVWVGDGIREAALNAGNLRFSYACRFQLGSKEKAFKFIK